MVLDTETNRGHTDSRVRIQCPSAAWSSFHRTPLIGRHIWVCVRLHLHNEESVRLAVLSEPMLCATAARGSRQQRQVRQRSGVDGKVIEVRFAVRSHYTCIHILVPFGRSTNCLNHSSQKALCPVRWRHSCSVWYHQICLIHQNLKSSCLSTSSSCLAMCNLIQSKMICLSPLSSSVGISVLLGLE